MNEKKASIDLKKYEVYHKAKMVLIEKEACNTCFGDWDVVCDMCGSRPKEGDEFLCINFGELHICKKCAEDECKLDYNSL